MLSALPLNILVKLHPPKLHLYPDDTERKDSYLFQWAPLKMLKLELGAEFRICSILAFWNCIVKTCFYP